MLLLLLLTPGIPEYLTGSSSATLLFVDPPAFLAYFLINAALYTTGALLIREAVVRWGKGWGSVLLLGAAYGIVEEGLAVHTFFQAAGQPVGILGAYGRLWGVNWVWAAGLTAFHAVYSIALPILLLGLAYPATKGRSLLGRRGIVVAGTVFVVDVVALNAIVPSHPNPAQALFFLGLVGLLVCLAFRFPTALLRPRPGRSASSFRRLVLLGTGLFFLWLLVGAFLPHTALPPVVDGAVLLGVGLGLLLELRRGLGAEDLERAQLAVAIGLVGALVPWELLLVVIANPVALVLGVVSVYALWRLRRPVWARTEPRPPAPVPVAEEIRPVTRGATRPS